MNWSCIFILILSFPLFASNHSSDQLIPVTFLPQNHMIYGWHQTTQKVFKTYPEVEKKLRLTRKSIPGIKFDYDDKENFRKYMTNIFFSQTNIFMTLLKSLEDGFNLLIFDETPGAAQMFLTNIKQERSICRGLSCEQITIEQVVKISDKLIRQTSLNLKERSIVNFLGAVSLLYIYLDFAGQGWRVSIPDHKIINDSVFRRMGDGMIAMYEYQSIISSFSGIHLGSHIRCLFENNAKIDDYYLNGAVQPYWDLFQIKKRDELIKNYIEKTIIETGMPPNSRAFAIFGSAHRIEEGKLDFIDIQIPESFPIKRKKLCTPRATINSTQLQVAKRNLNPVQVYYAPHENTFVIE